MTNPLKWITVNVNKAIEPLIHLIKMSWSRVKMKAGLMIKGNLINHLSKLKLQVICTVGWKWIPRYVIDISFILCRVSSSIIFTCHSQDLFSHRETLLRVVGGLTISPMFCVQGLLAVRVLSSLCALKVKSQCRTFGRRVVIT